MGYSIITILLYRKSSGHIYGCFREVLEKNYYSSGSNSPQCCIYDTVVLATHGTIAIHMQGNYNVLLNFCR